MITSKLTVPFTAERHVVSQMSSRSRTILALVLGAVGSVPVVFLIAWRYFAEMVGSEYASGERTSTDGDSIMIPIAGVTITWVLLLAVTAAVIGAVFCVRWAVRRLPPN